MDKKYQVNYDFRIRSIEIEIDEFDDRYKQGDSIQKIEWSNMSSDWHGDMCATLDYLISEVNHLSASQRKQLDNILFRLRNMKPKIIEKNYAYRDVFDLTLPA